jgi:hypothetical protein
VLVLPAASGHTSKENPVMIDLPPVTLSHRRVTNWLHLIQAEYREMPGLNLTRAQMLRLWGLDPSECDALIAALVDARVLRRTAAGSYVASGRRH